MNTPWGKSDSTTKITRGVSWVNTPSHGGLAVTIKAATDYLSSDAQMAGLVYGNYFFFEEDCLYAIAFYENPAWDRYLNPTAGSDEEIRTKLLPIITLYKADYLLSRGIPPADEQYKQYLEHKETDRLRAEKSPNLIVSASGDWAEWVPAGLVGVVTADNHRYLLPAEDYPQYGYRLSSYPKVKVIS